MTTFSRTLFRTLACCALLGACHGGDDVVGPSPTFTVVSAGGDHTCGLTSAGAAYCWGGNHYGQLGDGTDTSRTRPVPVQGGLTFKAVVAGAYYTCGLTGTGHAYCWGINRFGQLGDSSASGPETCAVQACSRIPVAVAGGLTFSTVSAGGYHVCGLTPAGAAYCWGESDWGELGDGLITGPEQCASTPCSTVPVPVSGGLTFSSVTAGEEFTCGLTDAGAAYCWGDNSYGELAQDSTTGPQLCAGYGCSDAPVAVLGGITFHQLSAGAKDACGVTSAGAAYCWGYNVYGQLGDGTDSGRAAPVAVQGGHPFAGITDGDYHHCGVTASGSAYCWGLNSTSQLGDGTDSSRTAPVSVQGGLTFAAISGGNAHTCGVTMSGATYCWGENDQGQLGNGTVQPSSVPIPTDR